MSIIDRARDALKNATPGPWAHYGDGNCEVYSEAKQDGEYMAGDWVAIPFNDSRREADAALIAAAPTLAAEVVRRHEQLGKLADELDEDAELQVGRFGYGAGSPYRDAAARIRQALEGAE